MFDQATVLSCRLLDLFAFSAMDPKDKTAEIAEKKTAANNKQMKEAVDEAFKRPGCF